MIFNKNCRSEEVRIVDIQIDYGAIGKRIRSARMKMSMTQETLSNLIDVSPTYISTIENGHTKLSLPTLISIAPALETTVDHLLYDNIPVLVSQYDADMKEIMDGCSPEEKEFLMRLMKSAREALRDCKPLY